jgi:hypothetical protein
VDDGELGWLILKALAVLLVVTVAGLLLDSIGVPLGGYLVLGAVGAYVIVVYVFPWLPTGPRKRGRRGE